MSKFFHACAGWLSFICAWMTASLFSLLRTQLRILTDLDNAVVWMVSSCRLISKSSCPFLYQAFGDSPDCINRSWYHRHLWCSIAFLVFWQYLSTYLCFRFLWFSLCGQPGKRNPLFSRFCYNLFGYLLMCYIFLCIFTSYNLLISTFKKILSQNIYTINTIYIYIYIYTDQIRLSNSPDSSQKCFLNFFFVPLFGYHPIQSYFFTL